MASNFIRILASDISAINSVKFAASTAAAATRIDNFKNSPNLKSLDSAESSSSPPKLFTLFQRPCVIVPSFDIHRWLGNFFAQLLYERIIEKEYTKEGFLNGATQAAILCAEHISTGNWDRLSAIAGNDLVELARGRYETLTETERERIRFTEDDVICSFLHSAILSGKRIFRMAKPGNFHMHMHVVLYVRKDKNINIDEKPTQLLKVSPPGSIHIVNVALSRIISPLGLWKVMRINFFDNF